MPRSATLRSLARAPGLSLTVAGTLAIGIAIVTVTFGVVYAALFRQPPFEEAERLAMLYLDRNPRGEPPSKERWSFARFELLRERQQSFEEVASYTPSTMTLSGDAGAEPALGEGVSASYFRVVRVGASLGRLFSEAEDDPARPTPVVLLGHDLWTRRFAADASILGRSVRLNAVPLTVIGVMPPGFGGLSGRSDYWVPRTMLSQLTYAEYVTTDQNFISAVGRLRADVGWTSARTELAVLGAEIQRSLPSDPAYPEERVTASAATLNAARASPTVRRSLFVLLGAVAALHLLACANVTNLLLGRAASRRRESAVRLALGCGARRLVGQHLAEGFTLSTLGAALGIALAYAASARVSPPTNVWRPRNFYGSLAPFDTPAFGSAELAFGVGLYIVTTLLVTLPLAAGALRIDLGRWISGGTRAIAGGAFTLRRPSARAWLVGIEATLAMLLLVTAGLLVDSFRRMRQVGLGVEPDHILTFWVIPSEVSVPPEGAPAFVWRLLDAISGAPGVRSVSVDGGAPLAGTASSVLLVEGRPAPAPGEAPPVLRHYVGPDHFSTLGIPLRRGRVFTAADVDGAPRVTVISETAARRFWPDQDPLGQRVWFGGGSNFDSPERSAEIVGIVGDVIYAPLDTSPNLASFYTPYAQFTYASRMVFVRTVGDPWSALPAVRKAVATVDPELALNDPKPLGDIVSGSWARNRFDAMLFAGFGVAALLLAASGIFAVLSYAVANRTRELGVRMALGADSRRLLRQVLAEGLKFPVVGLSFGVAASVGTTRLLQSSLYETSPLQPQVFVSTAALLIAVAAAACLVPAWRATRVDAIEALRAE